MPIYVIAKSLSISSFSNLITIFDRILCDLQATNGTCLADIQGEVSDGTNIAQIIGNLTQMIARDL